MNDRITDVGTQKRVGTSNQHHERIELTQISTQALRALLDSKTPLTLIDARTGVIDDGRRIPGAVALKCYGCARKSDVVANLVGDKNRLIVVYCGSDHFSIAARLTRHLVKAGYPNTLFYPAGLLGWMEAGLGTVSQEPDCCRSMEGKFEFHQALQPEGEEKAIGRFVDEHFNVNLP